MIKMLKLHCLQDAQVRVGSSTDVVQASKNIKGHLEEVKASLEIKEGIKCILSLFL